MNDFLFGARANDLAALMAGLEAVGWVHGNLLGLMHGNWLGLGLGTWAWLARQRFWEYELGHLGRVMGAPWQGHRDTLAGS